MQKIALSEFLSPLLAVLLLAGVGCASQSEETEYNAAADNAAAAAARAPADEINYPRTVKVGERYVVVHPPQIRSWEDFEVMEGIAVVELIPEKSEPSRYGVVSFTADAIPDLAERTVALTNLKVTSLTEDNRPVPADVLELFADAFPQARTMPLDLVLSHLAEDVIAGTTQGIKSEVPKIFFSQSSAVLVLLHGDPVWAPITDSTLTFAANTNWPLFKAASGKLYLNHDDTWLSADKVAGQWAWADTLTSELSNLPDDGNWTSSKKAAAAWSGRPIFAPPRVFTSTTPAELILLVGEPQLVAIADAGIEYVANTESQLFRVVNNWYYLVSGRWFTSPALSTGWEAVTELPEAFASIPADHEKADVLAMVPDTPEAKMAALDALVPKKNRIPVNTSVPAEVSYAGDPTFENIDGTAVSYAKNTNYEILEFSGKYYLCYSGIWYVADSALGPWLTAKSVPDQIYDIPPSSPVYHTTYVKVYDTSPTHVTYSYTGGYYHTYLYYGVPVYGSGWYYPPYYYYYGGYPLYYGYPYTYGSASFYNPRTGTYGSVSRAYGPYGGWGYASGYNPNTGTYARAETWYDYDEWHRAGEAYNPSTGRYAETSRYYDADNDEWKTNTSLEGRRGDVDITREWDDDSGRLDLSTSRGGEGTFTRNASDGGWDTAGSYTTADGRTIESSGRYEGGQGSSTLTGSEGGQGTIERSIGPDGITREGSFSKDGQTIDTSTTRSGRDVVTQIEGSEGGKGVVSGRGADRTFVGESGSGDVYAARDGSVYKRSDEGWYKRDGDDWSQIENPRNGDNRTTSQNASRANSQNLSGARDQAASSGLSRDSYNRDYQNRQRDLNRDYTARQRGQSRSRNYSSARSRMGSGGGMRGRRR
jgi:hypothetical protein